MKVDRITRINALLKREIGCLLFRVMQEEEDFDLAAVTITHVSVGRDLRDARVWISILGHEERRGRMLRLLAQHRGEIQAAINRDIGLKFTPRLHFRLDRSVEKGDRVLDLLSRLEREESPGDPLL